MAWVVPFLAGAFLWSWAAPNMATPDKRAERPKIAVTDLADVDQDFAFQGEYLGTISTSCAGTERFGLQVVAQGNGKFQARGYPGGLPGSGWSGESASAWTGKRDGNVVQFWGADGQVILADNQARILDDNGADTGRLPKVERQSTTLGAHATAGAIVLFDGTDASELQNARITEDGLLAAGAVTRRPVHDFRLHLEFRTPYMPYARGQGRGNSGIYIQRRYEVQVLDSFGLPAVFNGCGALYRQHTPDLNMSFPPLSWQTYDIWFRAARWDACGNKFCQARITVLHNGVPIHRNRPITTKTGHGQPESPEDLPILFQRHGNPVTYRNVWLVSLGPETHRPSARKYRAGRPGHLLRRIRCHRVARRR